MLPDLEVVARKAATDSRYSDNAGYVAWLDGFQLADPNRTMAEITAAIGMTNADGSYTSLLQRYTQREQRIRARQRSKRNVPDLLNMRHEA